jgi:hypothetical protein
MLTLAYRVYETIALFLSSLRLLARACHSFQLLQRTIWGESIEPIGIIGVGRIKSASSRAEI